MSHDDFATTRRLTHRMMTHGHNVLAIRLCRSRDSEPSTRLSRSSRDSARGLSRLPVGEAVEQLPSLPRLLSTSCNPEDTLRICG
jgi:hypothetical protein